MARRRRRQKRNPVGWGDAGGAALSFVVPTLLFLSPAGPVASGAAVLTGVVGGLLGAYSNGFHNSSVSRGYAAGSALQVVFGLAVWATLPSDKALPPPPASRLLGDGVHVGDTFEARGASFRAIGENLRSVTAVSTVLSVGTPVEILRSEITRVPAIEPFIAGLA